MARRAIPVDYRTWNKRWGAPFGRQFPFSARLRKATRRELGQRVPKFVGPFGFQDNSTTRRFEYPWAFHAINASRGDNIVEIGGGLSGLQFVLSKSGARVRNVDPGESATGLGWPVHASSIARLNRAFGTDVRLISNTLEEANLASDSVDKVYSISAIEHIPADEIPSLAREVARVLRPGGSCVLTIDLFLNLHPFSRRSSNEWGTNVAPASLVQASGLELIAGDPAELFGYPEFDPANVLARLDQYFVGKYPVMAQCLVLRKPLCG